MNLPAKRNLPNSRMIGVGGGIVLPENPPVTENPFKVGDFNSEYFRIPSTERLNNGDILVFSQVQYGGVSDYTYQDVAMSRSTDGGKTWGDKEIVVRTRDTNCRIANPTTIYDVEENKLILFVTEFFETAPNTWWAQPDNMWDMYVLVSIDNGETWERKSIKEDLISLRKESWASFMPGLGTGVKMKDGKYVIAVEVGRNYILENTLLYSDDLENWQLGNLLPERGDEANIVLLDDDTILLNARNYATHSPEFRKIFVTDDLGETWQPHETHQTIPENRATMGHTLKITIDNQDYIIFSHMQSENYTRKDLGISVLNREQTNWVPLDYNIMPYPYDGYSVLAWNENYPNDLFIIYERYGDILFEDISHLISDIQTAFNLS